VDTSNWVKGALLVFSSETNISSSWKSKSLATLLSWISSEETKNICAFISIFSYLFFKFGDVDFEELTPLYWQGGVQNSLFKRNIFPEYEGKQNFPWRINNKISLYFLFSFDIPS